MPCIGGHVYRDRDGCITGARSKRIAARAAQGAERTSPAGPLIAVAVRPPGSVSVAVTAPLVGVPPVFLTVIVYCAPVWPWMKLPLCVLLTIKSGPFPMVVGSLAPSLAVFSSPPPDTVAVLVTDAGAFAPRSP